MELRRVEAGVYVTTDDKWTIERTGSIGEWDTYDEVWTVNSGTPELRVEMADRPTKRECVQWLTDYLAKGGT